MKFGLGEACVMHTVGYDARLFPVLPAVGHLLEGLPHAGSGVVRIDPLRFLAGCCTRRLNQAMSVYHILACCIIVLWFIRAPFYVLLVFVTVFTVFWLF